jgi:predicted PurR-regulated permease PerM
MDRIQILIIFVAAVLLVGVLELVRRRRLLERYALLVGFGFVLWLLLHFSVAISRLNDQSKILAQRVGLLEERLRGIERPDTTVFEGEASQAESTLAGARHAGKP